MEPMTEIPETAQDLSHLDRKYFLDAYRYNCPFCNRGSVSYRVKRSTEFDWSAERKVYAYIVECGETNCKRHSLHLSNYDFPEFEYVARFSSTPENLDEADFDQTNLDSLFFFHQPTSFFTLDARIDGALRELISETENCLKMNFLVGASACLRKMIYELIEQEKARVEQPNGRIDYRESIMALKDKFQRVPPTYFDALSGIQQMASDKIHEGSWEAWDSGRLKVLLELAKNVLHEMYVVPKEQEARAAVAATMLSQLKTDRGEKPLPPDGSKAGS